MDINVVGIYLDESTYKGVYILDIVGTSHDFSQEIQSKISRMH